MLVGSFNPAIIHPSWFARFEILPPSDLEAVDTPDLAAIVTPEFARFAISWLRVQVTVDHFELSTLEPDRVPLLRDAGVNIFRLLSHTPISAMGINRTAHYPLKSGQWSTLPSTLAPASAWAPVADAASLVSLTVQVDRADDGDPGFIRITAEPSQRFAGGLFVAVNDHHDLESANLHKEAAPAVDILGSGWSKAIAAHDRYTKFLIGLAGGK